jgi:hypothetical protein
MLAVFIQLIQSLNNESPEQTPSDEQIESRFGHENVFDEKDKGRRGWLSRAAVRRQLHAV